MPRTVETVPLTKHTLWLYEGDFERLGIYFPEITASVAIRRIVRAHLDKLDAKQTVKTNLDVETAL